MRFDFVSSIYALACGHTSSVRSTRVAHRGDEWHCLDCGHGTVVTAVVTLGA